MKTIAAASTVLVAPIALLGAACGSVPPAATPCPANVAPIAVPSGGQSAVPSGGQSAVPSGGQSAAAAVVTRAARVLSGRSVSVTVTATAASLLGSSCSPVGGTGGVDVSTGEGTLSLSRTTASAPETYTVVFAARDVFARLPSSQTRLLPAGRDWVDAPISVPGDAAYAEDTRSYFTQLLSVNPRLVIEELATGVTTVSSGSAVVVGNGYATEYGVAVDLARVRNGLSGPYAEPFSRLLSAQLPAPGGATTTTPATAGSGAAPSTPTSSSTTNPWLTPPPPSTLVGMTVVVGSDGALDSVTYVPAFARLGWVTMSFAVAGHKGTGAGVAAPPQDRTVDIRSVVKVLGEDKGEAGGR